MSRKKVSKQEESESEEQEESDNGAVYEVEKILGKKKIGTKIYYKVQWKGYPLSEATWEPLSNLSSARELIKEYRRHEFKDIVETNYSFRVRSVIHAEKRNGTIYYTIVDKNEQLKEIPSNEARKICPQKIIDYYSENFNEEPAEESEEEAEQAKKTKQVKKAQKEEPKEEKNEEKSGNEEDKEDEQVDENTTEETKGSEEN